MGAAHENGPCISQGMGESVTRHYLHDAQERKKSLPSPASWTVAV